MPGKSHRGAKIAHKTKRGAYLHLWGSYWRYWSHSRFRALPNLRFRSVYACSIGQSGRHWHIGRTPHR